MIIKRNLGNVDGVNILEFGEGDIRLAQASGNGYEAVIFKNGTPEEVGTITADLTGVNTDEWKPEVVMAFTNPDSVDVVIEMLELTKANLLKGD